MTNEKKKIGSGMKTFLVFLLLFLVIYILNYTYTGFDYDNLWNFSMIYKIVLGYIPYKEINMIITPLFHFLGAGLFKIAGANFQTFYIYGALIDALLGTLFYKSIQKLTASRGLCMLGMAGVLYILCSVYGTNYNLLMMIFPVLLILLEMKKEIKAKQDYHGLYDVWAGILIGAFFLTKQTIGAVFGFGYLLYFIISDKKINGKVNDKGIGRMILAGGITLLPTLIYLAVHGAFFDFVDLCFAGILDFGQKNSTGSFLIWQTMFVIIVSISCLLWFFKIEKDRKMLLLGIFSLCSLIIIVPLINTYHIYISLLIPLLAAITFLTKIITALDKAKVQKVLHAVACLAGVAIIAYIGYENVNDILYFEPTSLGTKYEVYKGLNRWEGHKEEIENVTNYVLQKEADGFSVFIMSPDASFYMNPLKRNNNKFDLILQGNLGYKGEERLIEQIKCIENPLFLKKNFLIFQESLMVDDYIKENYRIVDKIGEYDVYQK